MFSSFSAQGARAYQSQIETAERVGRSAWTTLPGSALNGTLSDRRNCRHSHQLPARRCWRSPLQPVQQATTRLSPSWARLRRWSRS